MLNPSIALSIPLIEVKLCQSLYRASREKTKAINKDLSWLQFATMTKTGNYRMLTHKELQWKYIEEIVDAVAPDHTGFTRGNIVDILSELVNTTVADRMKINNLLLKKGLTNAEDRYVKTLMLEVSAQPTAIPHHPWLFAVTLQGNDFWEVIDLASGHTAKVKKQVSGGNVVFQIEYAS